MKPGYKQTEVGVIPEEWEVKSLGSVLSKGRLGGNYANQDAEAELPLMKMGNLARGYFDLSKVQFITPGVQPEPVHRLVYGDVLFNTRNTLDLVGKVAIWRDELPVAYYNSNLMRLEFDPEQVCSNEYANYSLNTEGSVSRLRALATGTTSVAAIYTRDLMKLQVLVPPTPEQRAIAAALSDVDGLLGGLDRLIAKKRDLKQAAMQQLLTGQTRLPGFHGEWEVKRLGDVGEISSAGVDKKIRPDEVPVRLVNYLDAYHKDFIYSKDLNHWVTAPPQQAKRCAVQKGDVFFTPTSETRDDIGNSAVAMEDIPDAAYSYHVARLRLHEPWDLCFRTYAFKTRAFLDQAETLCDGNGTRYVISQGKFRSMTVQVPPLPEQTAIAEVLTEMDGELAVLEQRREKTRALKQAMMQELLTGRTRLL